MSGAPPRRSVAAVTGASGFVGGVVAARLERAGHDVLRFGRRPVDRMPEPLRSTYRVWDIEQGPLDGAPRVDAVVHCAGAVDDWGTHAPFYRANVLGTEAVLDTWPDARFVHVSSASIYDPRADHSHVVESDADPRDAAAIDRIRWLNAYGRTKRLAEHVVAARAAEHSIILRPHAVYGPGDTQLLPRLLRRVRFGRLLMAGAPGTRVSLTHVDSFADAAALAVESDATGACNIADPVAHPLGDVLPIALRRAGLSGDIAWIPGRAAWAFACVADATHLYGRLPRPIVTRYQLSHIIHDFVMDIDRARGELGYDPSIDTIDGMQTVDVPTR